MYADKNQEPCYGYEWGGGKRYVHYVTIRAKQKTGSYYGWTVLAAPIVNDTSTPFTLDTLNQWLFTLWGNHNMTVEVTGLSASGYYDGDEVLGLCYNAPPFLGYITKTNNGMGRSYIDPDVATVIDKISEI